MAQQDSGGSYGLGPAADLVVDLAGDDDALARRGRSEPAHAEPPDVARLAATEALQRLELLSEVSSVLDATLEDNREAAQRVASVCVPAFADLCAVELVGPKGDWQTVAYSIAEGTGITAPDRWRPLGVGRAVGAGPWLVYEGDETSGPLAWARRRLNADP